MSEREGRLTMALIAMLQVRNYPCTCDDERLLDLPCPRHSEAEPAARKLADDALASLAPSAPLIPQSRAEEAVEREREEIVKLCEAFLHSEGPEDSRDDLDRLARYSNGTVRRIVERIRARKTEASRE